MAKYIGSVCKLCRREGEKLYLKGSRCLTPKCSFDKRAYTPGQHGPQAQWRRQRESDYAIQLRAKQKARRIYGVLEKQFRNYYRRAVKARGLTGVALLQELEVRLDNIVYRLGYARSRAEARQLVSHGHFLVNGHRSNIPSQQLSPGDEIAVRELSKKKTIFQVVVNESDGRNVPTWLERDEKLLTGKMLEVPNRQEIFEPVNEQLIVEFYSR
ncbi:MAG TPA: 30S ribosomal protein S4 [Chloroflexi bacterium]|nr:30S ribosomal protein S4 [Chloroflexota bacterium]|tara:strand:+ start:1581 stop:2219 length:639 start_codon:yes stop_codon:yes gene_type:complete